MIESFFFDLDGTLQGFGNNGISDSTLEALYQLKKNKKKIYIATGRNFSDMPPIIFDIGFDGYINNNGGICSDIDREIFSTEYINPKDVESLLAYDLQHPIAFSYMSLENPFSINRINENVEKSFEHFNFEIPKTQDLRALSKDKIIQIIIFENEEKEKFILDNVLNDCIGARWIKYFVDINHKKANKWEGIKKVAQRYNLDLSKTMCFGDGGNDLKMLHGCKIGIAMGNANPKVKEIADYITTSVDEDGIWNALKHYDFVE